MTDGKNEKSASQDDEGKSLVEVKITDLLGLSKAASEMRKVSDNVVKSIEKGIGKLSEPLLKVVNAKAEAHSKRITSSEELNAQKNELRLYLDFINSLADARATQESTALLSRVLERQIVENTNKQLIRENVARFALQELKEVDIPSDCTNDIDEDWLNSFWTFVEQKSSEDIQRIFARILAGECLKPGSYSARLLQILSVMTKDDAIAFEVICSVSISDEEGAYIIEPIDEFDNFLEEALSRNSEANEVNINNLESLGLLGRSSIIAFDSYDHGKEKDIGGTSCLLEVVDTDILEENAHFITGIPFSRPGEELRDLVSISPNQYYLQALKSFSCEYLGVQITEVS